MTDKPPSRRAARQPRPLDSARMEELALAYVARFATSAAKLEAYLRRKLRERGWEGEVSADPAGLVAAFVARGYVDDETFARARARGLASRGYGPRRVAQALHAAGIAQEVAGAARPGIATVRRAALIMARKRGFGPFGAPGADETNDADGPKGVDRAKRERQLAAMLRAGHSPETARGVLDARSVEQAEEWAAEHDDD